MGLNSLQAHMHQLENLLTPCKEKKAFSKPEIDFFLRGIDGAKDILEGKKINFSYTVGQSATPPASAPKEAPVAAKPAAPTASPTSSISGKDEVKIAPAPSASPKSKSAGEKPIPSQKPLSAPSKIIPISHATGNVAVGFGKALVVDDEEDIVEIISGLLSDVGFEVFGKTDPIDAINSFSKISPDVVFSDISMPKMSGIELLSKIREKDADVPVIMVSGFVTKEVLMDSIQKGIYSVIEKPFDDKRIIQAAMNASQRYQVMKLLNRSINLILYQFSDLDDFLKTKGNEQVRTMLNQEVNALLDQRRRLKELKKKAA